MSIQDGSKICNQNLTLRVQFQNPKIVVVAVFAYDRYMGVGEGGTLEEAKQKVSKQVISDLTKTDFAKDNYIYH